MKKLKIIITSLISTVILGGLIYSNNTLTSNAVVTSTNIEDENITTESLENVTDDSNSAVNQNNTDKEEVNSVTPDNYQEALQEYKMEHPEKIDPNNPTAILHSFMAEYNLDYIETSNY